MEVPREGFVGLVATVGAGDDGAVEVSAEFRKCDLDATDSFSDASRDCFAGSFDRPRAEAPVLAPPGRATQLGEKRLALALDPFGPGKIVIGLSFSTVLVEIRDSAPELCARA